VRLDDLGLCLANFVLLAVVFTPLERSFPARATRWLRPAWTVDVRFFAGQYLVWSILATTAIGLVRVFARAHAPIAVRASFTALPIWAQVLVAVVAGDVCVYWFHRACHRFDVLWRFHAVHHSVEHLDWLAAHREHPLDGLFTQLFQNLPALLLGLRMDVLAPLVVFRNAWAIFIHSNVRVPLGPLGLLFGDPALHHWHHARVERTTHNFANLAPWLDVIFGTHHRPEGEETYPLGLPEPWPEGYLAQLVRPFLRR
jgi:sterol desaturase/sphingolipid hydroxylase (fatty acid hydroxylase superfamily)